jgi:hypothetical protein
VEQQATSAQQQCRPGRPRDPERREERGHRREVGGPQGAAPGRQEGRHCRHRGFDARDDPERSLLQQGHGQPGVRLRQGRRKRHRSPERVLGLFALAGFESRHAALDEAEAHPVQAGDVPLHARPPDLAQRAFPPFGVAGGVSPDEARPQLRERRLRALGGPQGAGRRGPAARLRREQQQETEGDRGAHAPPARVFPT